jgi:hypothetical protein
MEEEEKENMQDEEENMEDENMEEEDKISSMCITCITHKRPTLYRCERDLFQIGVKQN